MSSPLTQLCSAPVRDLEQFIRNRWMHMGGTGGLDGIEAAGGPSANAIRAICAQMAGGGTRQRRSDTPDRLAIFLGFDHWEDLFEAQADPKHKGVRWRLGYVKLTEGAYKIAAAESKAAGKDVGAWVSGLVEAANKSEDAAVAGELKRGKRNG